MQKKHVTVLGLAGLLSLAGAGGGMEAAHALEWGTKVSIESYTWKEETACGTLKENGPQLTGGGYLSGTPLAQAPPLRLRGVLQLSLGWVDYDTVVQSLNQSGLSCTPENTDTFYLGFKGEGDVGWRMAFGRSRIEPFLGLAYRTWLRSIQDGPTASGYPEIYRLLYGRVGLRAGHEMQNGIGLNVSLSADPVLWARETIDWEGVTGETLRVKNGRKVGWTMEAGAHWPWFDLTAYWQAIRLGESNRVSCYSGTRVCVQPDSKQDAIGLQLGYLF